MRYRPENPLIIQRDRSLLLETGGPHFEEARDALGRFAELVKTPTGMHTWKLTPLSLWNAASAGVSADAILDTLRAWSRYEVPPTVPVWIDETIQRYGQLRLLADPNSDRLLLEAATPQLFQWVLDQAAVAQVLGPHRSNTVAEVDPTHRGVVKQALIKLGWPVVDQAGFVDGAHLPVVLLDESVGGEWNLRTYQRRAVGAFLDGPTGEGGSGVVVLPCGAGKTIVGLGAMAEVGMQTLILCVNTTALRQWKDEILRKTSLTDDEVGEYSGQTKEIRPVTLTTYQMLTWRKSKDAEFAHFGLFDEQAWGLVIYDEVHLLPAPVFRTVAALQAMRRLGLTATLVREDGHESDVFALIGPKRFDMPWRHLEADGWIATARCVEVRVGLQGTVHADYATAEDRDRFRIAATNSAKIDVVKDILERHPQGWVLIIGMYLDQLHALSDELGAPLVSGETRQAERDERFAAFRRGELPVLLISRVGNFSVDLPDARVAIQVSGTWGSRQEEAQRLGRVLRPKSDGSEAHFYTVVSRDTVEQDFAAKRQLFLSEQGYQYAIEAWGES